MSFWPKQVTHIFETAAGVELTCDVIHEGLEGVFSARVNFVQGATMLMLELVAQGTGINHEPNSILGMAPLAIDHAQRRRCA